MTVELAIGRSRYKINCEDSKKEKLLRLAKNLNKKVNDSALALRDADDKTLLVIAALSLEEEVENLNNLYEDDSETKLNDQDLYDAISENMDNITDYIEQLISKIQNY